MSPATRLVSSGNTHEPAKPRITSGMANPEACTQRPNRVSCGTLSCMSRRATKRNGAATQTTTAVRVRACAASFRSSQA